ncbi:TrkH family potassium uptake protein [Clostridium aminobutyricum]|uniref:TrkH family potassium uptake protein n=1 Tax=Clostridium aminobutyricum TaxID=33953 RepID=A0A939D6L7_CLOAM|nr:TrkH family potassium uptake protein [Clostridium aminobutyricum]MBN7772026.1 TrkH family potassium uptake protein [Clostridium aminobutyricum]
MSFNYRLIFKILCLVTVLIGGTMSVPLATAFIYQEWREVTSFFILMLILILSGYIGFIFIKPESQKLRMRDGYLVVSSCWITASLLGALPYLISGYALVDGIFESVAGFTTTGASVVDLESLPHSLVMWKGVSSWLGGMGILVLAISILPALGISAYSLAYAEVPGISLSKVANRISDSSKMLYLFYCSFTILEFLLLLLSPMDTFDAIITTMGSVSTSGLTSMYDVFLSYDSLYIEIIVCTFTFLASINFTLYYHVLNRNWRIVLHDIEFRGYAAILGISSALVVATLYFTGSYNFMNSLRYGIFHVVSFSTTSGFAIVEQESWPTFCMSILCMLMLIGGCSSSTCGSIKVIRFLVAMKLIGRGFMKRIHPRSVYAVKLGGEAISAQKVSHLTAFIMLFFVIIVFSSLLLSLQNLDLFTTLSSSLAMISNTGLGFGLVSDADYSVYCPPLRLVLCMLMIVGRLELFTIVVLFVPSFWNPDKYSYH